MPASVRSERLRNYDNWTRVRQTNTPFRTPTASIIATEPAEVKGGGWAALLATAHDAYLRDRQMTTEERVEQELRKLTQRNRESEVHGSMAGFTTFSLPPTPDDFTPLGGILGRRDASIEIDEDETEKMVPSINYAVAELAKSLEESRKAFKKALKANEQLRREGEELKKENGRIQDLEAQLRNFQDWISPDVHNRLRQSWEAWADVAEKKIESQRSKTDKLTEELDMSLTRTELKEDIIVKLEERLETYQNWTSPYERKVLDATVDLLRNQLSGNECCRKCVQRLSQTGSRSPLDLRKPALGRQHTVA